MKVNPCLKCGRCDTGEKWAHDPCIAGTAGVVNACCGHGDADGAYFMFAFGPTIHGSAERVRRALFVLKTLCHSRCGGFASE